MYKQLHPTEDGLTFMKDGRKYIHLSNLKVVVEKDRTADKGKGKKVD